jgi:transposase
MGRSRGGLTTKLHALVDADGRPVGLRLTGGQVHDACEAEALVEAIPEGATLLGDKGYDSTAIREAAAIRNVWANIPSGFNLKQRFGFSPWLYRQRNLVERFFNRIKQFRGIAARYDKDAANYLAAINLICTRLWRNPLRVSALIERIRLSFSIAMPPVPQGSLEGTLRCIAHV